MTDSDKVREAIEWFRQPLKEHWEMTSFMHGKVLADRVEELEADLKATHIRLEQCQRDGFAVWSENAKLRAALAAVREAYDGDCWWDAVIDAVHEHVLPLTEEKP